MNRHETKRLKLHRETVRRLASRELAIVAGGKTFMPTCNTVAAECTNIPACNWTNLSICCP